MNLIKSLNRNLKMNLNMRLAMTMLFAAVCATGAALAAPPQGSGRVRGVIVAAPACPGPARPGQCAPRPTAGKIQVFANAAGSGAGDGKTLKTIATDSHGRFDIRLVPGTYRLVPLSANRPGKPHRVTVAAGSISNVELVVDTGMR
jgi:hypothetical protein